MKTLHKINVTFVLFAMGDSPESFTTYRIREMCNNEKPERISIREVDPNTHIDSEWQDAMPYCDHGDCLRCNSKRIAECQKSVAHYAKKQGWSES